jgi:hypothetical protein
MAVSPAFAQSQSQDLQQMKQELQQLKAMMLKLEREIAAVEEAQKLPDLPAVPPPVATPALPPQLAAPMKFSLVLVNDDRLEGDMKGAIDVVSISGKVVLSRSLPE